MGDLDKTILTFCIQNDVILARCLGEIEPRHFSDRAARLIFEEMRDYFTTSKKCLTYKVLDERLDERELEEDIQQECTSLFEEIEEEEDQDEREFDHHLERFLKAFTQRGWEGIVDRLSGNPEKDYSLIKQEAIPLFESDSGKHRMSRGFVGANARDFLNEYLETEAHPELAYGVLTGFDIIDQETYGMQPGELWLISGRHGSGKSIFLTNIAVNAYKAGKKVIAFSLEMPLEQYTRRFWSCYLGLPSKEIKGGKLTTDDKKRLKEGVEKAEAVAASSGADMLIIDLTSANTLTLEAEIRRAISTCSFTPDVVVVDYIGIMQSVKEGTSDWQEQGFIAEELRKLARDLNIPIITASQLNRDKKDKGTARISRSDIIGATVDVFLQIEEREAEDANEMTLLDDSVWIFIGKCRDGQSQQSFQLYKDFSRTLVKNKDVGPTPQERILGVLNKMDDDIAEEINKSIAVTVPPSKKENKQAQQNGDYIDAQ